ncbi:hypothetical protein BDY19DRAFT_902312 [Irpex rosettiformis]|uniref:Uncharacterized protein n=1 Tax=Irpex rosettiformis TaxID=378272 RepID=A0ACB8UGW2_9APHY|nr:hypothetical protein BDY19DRAFT_902312 [Irpex rosettiformis]
MEWWSVFFKVRKTVFFFISIASLLWAVVFSVYIAHLWNHLLWSQRGMVLGIIVANAFTAVMVYLMYEVLRAVVVFRIWLDFSRVVFLLLLHIAAALVFTIFGSNFSCATFKTKADCKHVDLAFVVGSWVMAGLLFGYISYLLTMLLVPQPGPKITPNSLLDSPLDRPFSISSLGSMSSTTRLIRDDSMYSYSRYITSPNPSRPASYHSSAPYIPVRRGPPSIYTGGTYGAMGTPGGPPPFRTPTSRSVSVTPPTPKASHLSTRTPPSLQTGEALSRSSSRSTTRPLPTSPAFNNPFTNPVSRNSTPHTSWSQVSSFDSPISPLTHSRANSHLDYWPPLLAPLATSTASARTSATLSPSLANMVPTWSPYEHRWIYSFSPPPTRPPSARTSMVTTGTTIRTHTSSPPQSIHSFSGSISNLVPESLQPSYTPSTPNPVHVRAESDPGQIPLYRSASLLVVPRTTYPTSTSSTAYGPVDTDTPLPNPFPLISDKPEVRRFGSVPNGRFYVSGQGSTYPNANDPSVHIATGSEGGGVRNAAHLAGALGRTPPRAEVADPEQWKALVFSAATGRTVV